MEPEKLYAVMVDGEQTPSKLYDDYEMALTEAKRLTRKMRKPVYVLLAITKLDVSDIIITPL